MFYSLGQLHAAVGDARGMLGESTQALEAYDQAEAYLSANNQNAKILREIVNLKRSEVYLKNDDCTEAL